MKNCGPDFHEMMLSKGLLETCMELGSNTTTNPIVREKVLHLIREWSEHLNIREFKGVYRDLMRYGVKFPGRDDFLHPGGKAATTTATEKKDNAAIEQAAVEKPAVKKPAVKKPAGEGGAKAAGTRLAKKKARKRGRGDATTGADAAKEASKGPAKKKAKTKSAEAAAKFTKKDWVCKCGFNNFSKNTACHKCKAAKPPRMGRNAAEDYLAAWAMMEKTEVDPVHHQYLLKQVGISSELREEFFEFFVQYCASMTKARRKKMLAGATKAHQRLGQILEALGGNANDGDSDNESESADDDETTAVGEATTAVEAAAAPTTAAPAKAQAKRKKRGNRGKKGRGQGAKSASAVIVPATPTAQETTA